MKICSTCNQEKEDTEFGFRLLQCKSCKYLKNLSWREKNQEKVTKYNSDQYEIRANKPPKVEIKPDKEKVIKREKAKRVTMVRVKSTETRYVKLVRNNWDKELSGIKQRIKDWEDKQ